MDQCVPGMSGNKAESSSAWGRAGLSAAFCFLGSLWGLVIWISCPQAPVLWILAIIWCCCCMQRAGKVNASENPVGACQWV